jgi:uncharacterized protein (TIGR03905 family)
MSDNIEIREIEGIDEVRFQPSGVCSKLMNLKIKDNKILDMETVGGCSGNLKGIGSLVIGMDINEVIKRLQGLPCGSRPTSCPDQLSVALKLYLEEKSKVTVG